jgi:hypothetical protein
MQLEAARGWLSLFFLLETRNRWPLREEGSKCSANLPSPVGLGMLRRDFRRYAGFAGTELGWPSGRGVEQQMRAKAVLGEWHRSRSVH